MAYKNQNYMTNIVLKEQADQVQKDYVNPNQNDNPTQEGQTTDVGAGEGTVTGGGADLDDLGDIDDFEGEGPYGEFEGEMEIEEGEW